MRRRVGIRVGLMVVAMLALAVTAHGAGDGGPSTNRCQLPQGDVPCLSDADCSAFGATCKLPNAICVCTAPQDMGVARDAGSDGGTGGGGSGGSGGSGGVSGGGGSAAPVHGGGMTSPARSGCSYIPGQR